ncbi:hypothetical protein FQN54_005057 [Arachnomyces sp. PD_36]|nr:hypothetical protein FQN54_005057 [Arachnomyces sp. PD_36]
MAAPSPRILLISNAERGQCNVFLATARAILRADPDVDLHFASFPALEAEVQGISDDAKRTKPSTKSISWHSIAGQTHLEAVTAATSKLYPDGEGAETQWGTPNFVRPLSRSVTMAAIRDIVHCLMGWDGPAFMKVHDSVNDICSKVAPDLIVVDPLLAPALTAAWYHESPMCALSPNSIKDAALGGAFPWFLWTYPALMSGIPFPIPWSRKPLNIFYYFYALYTLARNQSLRSTLQHVTNALGRPARTMQDVTKSKGPDALQVFVNTLPELDFPWLPCPPHVIAGGPIVSRVQPISEADPELADWISVAPTIFVNLGTHTKLTEDMAAEFATALNTSLSTMDNRHPGDRPLQVLWKLKRAGEYDPTAPGSKIHSILKDKIESNRIRITSWLTPEPLAILQTGNIVCFIHHGGANSYNEAVLNGVPHVVLPSWMDCYEYAQRVEYLGIGRQGVRKQVPQVEASELSRELLTVIDGERSQSMKRKAQEFAAICKEKGDGADTVARKMLELARKS